MDSELRAMRTHERMSACYLPLLQHGFCVSVVDSMSAQEIIEQIKLLPPTERAAVARFVVEQDDSWIPEEFKEAMKDAEAGRCVEMETALFKTPPGRLQ
jgi:hypothetical protein